MSSKFVRLVGNYISAAYPLLWVQTFEEERAIMDLLKAEENTPVSKRQIHVWDSATGLRKGEHFTKIQAPDPETAPPGKLLDMLATGGLAGGSNLVILRDFHPFLQNPVIRRQLRNLRPILGTLGCTILFISPFDAIPEDLSKEIQIIDFDLPTVDELRSRLHYIHRSVTQGEDDQAKRLVLSPEVEAQVVEAAKGLTLLEAENAYAFSLCQNKAFNEKFARDVFEEKITQIRKSGLLTYLPPDTSFEHIGGLLGLKKWVRQRRKAFSQAARDYGLPYPKGMLLCGLPGCGKTLLAKATSVEMGLPLFQLDIGSLFDKLVGGTEQNFRKLIKVVDGLGSCILFIDEIEKSLSKSATSGAGDTGTSSRAFGTFLSWLSDHTTPVFVIGTSNNFTVLPPELVRKGRFSELFWLDLPSAEERQQIFQVILKKFNLPLNRFNIGKLASQSEGYTGAELEQAVIGAMYEQFDNNESVVKTEDILRQLSTSTPFSTLHAKELADMRGQAKGKLKQATEDGVVGLADNDPRLRDLSID